MNILNRLILELSNKEYFTLSEYETFLSENGLDSEEVYTKSTHQKALLLTVIDIFEAVCNDITILRRVETEFMTTDSAYKHLQDRISKLKIRVDEISTDPEDSNFTLMFSRG